ncbi:MAG: alkylation response protein AidB-like acyl-CoA dehydrogenase [Myxococcota bacterium]
MVITNDVDRAIPSREDLMARAMDLLPSLVDRASLADSQRKVPDETIADLRDAGLLRVMNPVEFGGTPIPTQDYVHIVIEMARKCPSTAWVYRLLSSHAKLAATFGEQSQADIWGTDPDAVVCSAYAVTGTATRTDGGFVLGGRFPFSSGCDHAAWTILGGRVQDENGQPEDEGRFFLVPMSDVEIVDDWHTIGMRGTGSKTLIGDGMFVPEHRVRDAPYIEGGTAQHGFAMILIGIALEAIDRFIEHASRPGRGIRPSLADTEAVQMTVAEAAAEVDAALLMLNRDLENAAPAAAESRTLPMEIQARNRRDHGFITKLTLQAVDRLFDAAGGFAVYDESPLQKSFRDAHTVGQHVALHAPLAFAQSGKILLGSKYEPIF